MNDGAYPKTGMANSVSTASSSQNILTADVLLTEALWSILGTRRGLVSVGKCCGASLCGYTPIVESGKWDTLAEKLLRRLGVALSTVFSN